MLSHIKLYVTYVISSANNYMSHPRRHFSDLMTELFQHDIRLLVLVLNQDGALLNCSGSWFVRLYCHRGFRVYSEDTCILN